MINDVGVKVALIEWNDKDFSVGHPKADEQHKKLVDIINRLHDALISAKEQDYKYTLFKEIQDYTEVHFSYEEKLMEEIDYPYLQKHKEMHFIFKTTILEQGQKPFKGEPIMISQVMSQLKNWLTDHILKEDRKIVGYLSSKQQPVIIKSCLS